MQNTVQQDNLIHYLIWAAHKSWSWMKSLIGDSHNRLQVATTFRPTILSQRTPLENVIRLKFIRMLEKQGRNHSPSCIFCTTYFSGYSALPIHVTGRDMVLLHAVIPAANLVNAIVLAVDLVHASFPAAASNACFRQGARLGPWREIHAVAVASPLLSHDLGI